MSNLGSSLAPPSELFPRHRVGELKGGLAFQTHEHKLAWTCAGGVRREALVMNLLRAVTL